MSTDPPPSAAALATRRLSLRWPRVVGLTATFILGLGVGYGVAVYAGVGDTSSASIPAAGDGTAGRTTVEPTTTEPTTTEPTTEPVVLPEPTDFKIAVKILKRSCFGSAGCNINYRIQPTYIGTALLSDDLKCTVVYEIRGGDSGPQTNTFAIDGDQISYPSEESISTPPNPVLTAKVTEVIE